MIKIFDHDWALAINLARLKVLEEKKEQKKLQKAKYCKFVSSKHNLNRVKHK